LSQFGHDLWNHVIWQCVLHLVEAYPTCRSKRGGPVRGTPATAPPYGCQAVEFRYPCGFGSTHLTDGRKGRVCHIIVDQASSQPARSGRLTGTHRASLGSLGHNFGVVTKPKKFEVVMGGVQ